ncbi:MAG: NAD(P)H-hydrate dehydratase, partial [Acidobacteria bacterium]|nr:NAD(P)H-hydrate dehydratase [Acidobacteriota bacterium]
MQKVVTAAEMREIDRLTTEKYGIPQILLMENAAQAAAVVIAEKLGGSVEDRTVLILCGKGSNGGDGAALARILWQQGADVEVCLFGLVEDAKSEAQINFDILRRITDSEGFELDQADIAFTEIAGLEEWLEYDSLNFQSEDPDVVVDAMFGTGLERPLDGVFEQVAAYLAALAEESPCRETLVVALDVPSGLCSDSNEPIGTNAAAHVTVTYTAPKLANVMPPAARFNGELRIGHIGSTCEIVNAAKSQVYVSDAGDARRWLEHTVFAANSYKNKRGHALLIAGSKDYSGAAILAGNAAIRSGAGLTTIATPESSRILIGSRVEPEVMVRGLAETDSGALAENAFEEIRGFSAKIDAVAIGCGLSTNESTARLVRKIVENRKTPLIIDADGLNALAPWSVSGTDKPPIILTPHDGEFLRLLGENGYSEISDRIKVCGEFAQRHHVILVLKGERAVVAEPGGRVVINSTGNSGLGKAGNGDTLTGILAGFAAQAVQTKADIFETVVAAVYV